MRLNSVAFTRTCMYVQQRYPPDTMLSQAIDGLISPSSELAIGDTELNKTPDLLWCAHTHSRLASRGASRTSRTPTDLHVSGHSMGTLANHLRRLVDVPKVDVPKQCDGVRSMSERSDACFQAVVEIWEAQDEKKEKEEKRRKRKGGV